MHRMKSIWFAPTLLLLTTSTFAAKSGKTLEIQADSICSSGSSQESSQGGYRLRYTIGTIGASNIVALSTSAYAVTPGILAGAPTLNPQNGDSVYVFGPENGRATLNIPAGSLTQDYLLYSSTSPASKPLRVAPAVIADAREKLDRFVSVWTRPAQDQVWELYLQEEDGRRSSASFQKPGRLTLPYEDDNNDGLLDGAPVPIRITSLSLWWLDEDNSLWVRLPNSTVNVSSKTVTAPVGHLSVFAVMGGPDLDPGAVFAFPVPWRPNGPNAGSGPNQTGTLSEGITFTHMPDIATIRIYTISGALVREISHTSGPQLIFDVKSDAGEILATGTYIYVIDSNGAKKTGKIAVIR
jgi:hypothetical protein